MFLRNFDNVCAICNGVFHNFGGEIFDDSSVYCKKINGGLERFGGNYGNPISFNLSKRDYGVNGSSDRTLALSFGSDTEEPTYEDYTYTTVTPDSAIARSNATRTTEYDATSHTYTVTLAMDFYNSTDNDIVGYTFVLRSDLVYSSSYNFIFYKELLKDENDELAPVTFPAKSYKHVEFKYTVQGHTYKPLGVSAS